MNINPISDKLSVRDMAFTGMFAAVIAVMSQISIPMPSGVPVTLQTFAVALAGFTLGMKRGTLSAAVYVLIGAAGVPVFSQLKGGIGALTGLTGGFIWGFIIMAFFCGAGGDSTKKQLSVLLGITGLVFLHLCGAAQFAAIRHGSFVQSIKAVSLPFMPKDIFSVLAALTVSIVIKKRMNFKDTCM